MSWNNLDLGGLSTMHCCVKILKNNWLLGSNPEHDDHFRELIQMEFIYRYLKCFIISELSIQHIIAVKI